MSVAVFNDFVPRGFDRSVPLLDEHHESVLGVDALVLPIRMDIEQRVIRWVRRVRLRARFARKGLTSRIRDDRNPWRAFRARPGLGATSRAPTRKQIVQSAAWGPTRLPCTRLTAQ